ncbi:MAG: MASE1 domain-containing protein [Terriglobia bacterium]
MSFGRFSRNLALILALTGAYVVAGKLGLRLAFANPSATPVWPPTGIALAALLVLGYRVWPAILLGAFLVNVTTAGSVATSASIAIGNTLEGLLGAYLANRYAGGPKAFARVGHFLRFAVLAGLVSAMVAATWGATTLTLGGYANWADYSSVWVTWWLGDAVGAVYVAPLLIVWAYNRRVSWSRLRIIEATLLFISIVLAGEIVFGTSLPGLRPSFPYSYLCFPLVTWAACRFGQREVLTGIFVLSAQAIWGTLNGLGPFARHTPNTSLLLLQGFVAILVVTGTVLGAAIAERKDAEERFRLVVESTPSGIVMVKRDGTITLVNSQTEKMFGYDRSEMIGRPVETLVPLGSRGEHGTLREDYLARPQARPMGAGRDLHAVRKGGDEFPVEIGLNPVETEDGLHVLGSITDITERKRAEEELRKAHDELELQVQQRTEQLSRAVDALRAEIGEREQAENSLRLLSARLLKLQDEERRRIARELHDSTGQKAAALAIDLSVVGTEADALGTRTRKALSQCASLADQIIREVRTLSYLLHPPMLDEVGLSSAIRWYADGVAERGGLEIDLQVSENLRRMPAEVETALFRIVQESLTNTLLHSGSKKARIHIAQENGAVMLEVSDKGRGIPAEILNHPEAILERLGVGIAGMRERVKQLGGDLEIQSGRGGTRIKAVVPVGGQP